MVFKNWKWLIACSALVFVNKAEAGWLSTIANAQRQFAVRVSEAYRRQQVLAQAEYRRLAAQRGDAEKREQRSAERMFQQAQKIYLNDSRGRFTSQAKRRLKYVISLFPDTPAADKARKLLEEIAKKEDADRP